MSLLDIIKTEKELLLLAMRTLMKQGNNNVIIRTIHPVGQGAFYSERYIDKEGKSKHLMVYDCGSNSPRKLEREISSSIKEKETINILFISHFDFDHVSGLAYLKRKYHIEKVVMPLISPFDKCYYLMDLPMSLQDIVLNPQAFFEEGTIISYVNPIEKEDDERFSLADNIIASGTRLNLSCYADWCYIPFNYDGAARRKNLETAFKNMGIDIDWLEKRKLDKIIENRAKIRKAYQSVCVGGANEASLVLYSGPIQESGICRWWYGEVWNRYFDTVEFNAACLYFGDTDLNQQINGNNDVIDSLSSHLTDVSHHIGTIQVPHHGSIMNFSHKILTKWNVPKHYYASFGEKNKYGHPSSTVLENIILSNPFYGVTENRNSIAIEYIYLNLIP
jgi:hypothetical protein